MMKAPQTPRPTIKQPKVHFMARVPGGPIRTERREVHQGDQTAVICAGGEYCVACQPSRKHLAVLNAARTAIVDFFVATGDCRVVTCPDCAKTDLYVQAVRELNCLPDKGEL